MEQEKSFLRNPHLDGSAFYWPKGQIAILCLHGFTATTVEVRKIASFFSEKGYTTLAPLLPGHGSSPTELNKTTWLDWVNEAEKSLTTLKKDHKAVYVLGESMGGLLSLHLMAKHPDLKAAMVFAPAIKIPNLWLSKVLWPIKKSLKKGPPDESIPQQSYKEFPLKAASSLYDFQKIVIRELTRINKPVIIFQGTLDKTVDPSGAVIVFEKLASEKKELVILKDSAHIILLDQQLTEVQEKCLNFIENINCKLS